MVTPTGLRKFNKINDLDQSLQVFKPVLTRINPVKLKILFRFILRKVAQPISVTPITFRPKINLPYPCLNKARFLRCHDV